MRSIAALKLAPCAVLIFGWLASPSQAQDASEKGPGVVDAVLRDERNQPKNAPNDNLIMMGDRIVMAIKDLDGWLYEEVRAGALPEQHWFDAEGNRLVAATTLGDLFDRSKDPAGTEAPNVAARNQRDRAREAVRAMIRDVRQKLYLQIGPARLRSIHPEDPFVLQDEHGLWHMVFVVSNSDKDKDEWAKLRNVHGEEREVSLSAAFDLKASTGELSNSYTLPSSISAPADSVTTAGAAPGQGVRFRIYSPLWAIGFCVTYLLALGIFGSLASRPNLLRDPDGPTRDGQHVYSLSRCVLAWWFFLVLGAWILLWVLTDSLDTMNSTALLLTGIGSATALGGTLAGKVRDAVADDDTPALASISLLGAERPRGFRKGPGAVLYDLLCDEDTIGFHRFQTLVWNGVLGLVFAVQVWSNFAMPTFDSTIFGLLGISSATFIGFKMTPTRADSGVPARSIPAAVPVDPHGETAKAKPA